MKITIDTDILTKHGLLIEDLLLMMAIVRNPTITNTIKRFAEDRIVENTIDTNYLILKEEYRNLIDMVLSESEREVKQPDLNYEELAKKLIELYPKGKKMTSSGKGYSWRDTVPVIANKLKLLRLKYGYEFTEEQAIEAVENYVKANLGSPYMQVLKYYLLKAVPDGIKSEFMSDIVNKDDNEQLEDWTSDLK